MSNDQFIDYLDADLVWRKKEISDLFMIYNMQENEVVLKSLVLLIYAHWEGYIKKSCKLYLKYVTEAKKKIKDLTTNFHALALKNQIGICIDNKNSFTLANEIKFIESYIKNEDKKFKITINLDNDQEKTFIDTRSKLTPKVFRSLMNILGIEYKNAFKARENYLNVALISSRNAIGHGSKLMEDRFITFDLNIEEVKKLKDFVFLLLDCLTDDLVEYVKNEYYLDSKAADRLDYEEKQDRAMEHKIKSQIAI